jgi:hypothetical protein
VPAGNSCKRPALILRPSYVLEKVGANKKGVNQKWYSHQKQRVSVIECSQPKGVKPKMKERKLRNGVNCQRVLE